MLRLYWDSNLSSCIFNTGRWSTLMLKHTNDRKHSYKRNIILSCSFTNPDHTPLCEMISQYVLRFYVMILCCPIHKRCWHIVQEFKRPLAKTNFLCKLWNYCVKFLHTVSKCSRQVSTCESQTTLTQGWHLDVNFTLARCRQPPPSSATTPSWPFIFSVQVFS